MYKTRAFKPSGWMTVLIFTGLIWVSASQAANDKAAQDNSIEKSDLNADLVVDTLDLEIFATRYLEVDWTEYDWCGFRDVILGEMSFSGQWKKNQTIKDKTPAYYQKHYGLLLDFINEYYACDVPPLPESLKLENYPQLLMRMAMSMDGSGDVYVADPRLGSIFFYDQGILPYAELKGLSKPLGLAVDFNGYLLVGNDGRDNVEVYDLTTGEMVTSFGEGLVIMPSSITVGPDGNIFVTDSHSHRIWMYDADYQYIRHFGSPGTWDDELFFPVDTEVIERYVDGLRVKEVFVADQGNERIQIFGMDGSILRHIYPGDCSMGFCEPPRLACLQALDSDALGRLHALDNFEAVVSILDPATGTYLGEYGEYGETPGSLWVPYGLVISDTGEAWVTSGIEDRIEIYQPQ